MKKELVQFLIFLADNSLVHGQRLAEWTSKAPNLEDDIAISNLALDYIGRARSFYQYAAECENSGRSEDDFAYLRNERQFTNLLIYELPIGDFSFTIARLFFVSNYEKLLFEKLSHSSDEKLAAIARKILKETQYHIRYSKEWFEILARGTVESRKRLEHSINELWPYTDELTESCPVDSELVSKEIIPEISALRIEWNHHISEFFNKLSIKYPEKVYQHSGGRTGVHTENLGHLLCELQFLQRAYPGASW